MCSLHSTIVYVCSSQKGENRRKSKVDIQMMIPFREWINNRRWADVEIKVCHSDASSPLSVSSRVKHLLRCRVWLFLTLACVVLKACCLRPFFLIFQSTNSYVEITYVSQCFAIVELVCLPLVPVQR